ncbi:MAG: relaxase/mobilization nuclease domain-containing protein [Clostridia bacterium]|nr:relaxase/mobilization nuclease domain-containing protein [Clostridia bacterium]
MATTKLWKVENRLDNVVNYASDKSKTENKKYQNKNINNIYELLDYTTNPDKTEKQFFVTGINCELDTAIRQMTQTKKKFNKDKYSKNNKIVAFHGYKSFAEGEVIPEIAHEIGVKLAEEMWGDRFEVVVSTHLNTDHIHNHFVLDSVSFKDGKKYYINFENTALLRKTSDDICDEYGLKILNEKTCKSGINFENFYRKSLSNSDYYKFAKEDIDYAINHSWTYKEFLKKLRDMGYEIYFRAEKISIRRYPYKRNIRIERAFGEQYSIDNIKNKICSRYPNREEIIKPKTYTGRLYLKGSFKKFSKPKGFKALYLYYCYLLKVYPKKNIEYKLTPAMRAEVRKMDEYSNEIRLLTKYDITNSDELNNCKTNLNGQLSDLIRQRNNLYYKRQNMAENKNKEKINKKIEMVSKDVIKIRNEIKLCNKIKVRLPEIKEQIKAFNKKENDEKQKEIQKKKQRRWER